ncbi:MAG: hypothetical protein AAF602_22035 [Myxococcota bacterium]
MILSNLVIGALLHAAPALAQVRLEPTLLYPQYTESGFGLVIHVDPAVSADISAFRVFVYRHAAEQGYATVNDNVQPKVVTFIARDFYRYTARDDRPYKLTVNATDLTGRLATLQSTGEVTIDLSGEAVWQPDTAAWQAIATGVQPMFFEIDVEIDLADGADPTQVRERVQERIGLAAGNWEDRFFEHYAVPLLITGTSRDNADIVMVPEEGEYTSFGEMVDAIVPIVTTDVHLNATWARHWDRVNVFGYTRFAGILQDDDGDDYRDWGFRIQDLVMVDRAVSVHSVDRGDGASGRTFSINDDESGGYLHEFAHSFFGLSDTYCGNTSYIESADYIDANGAAQTMPHHNVYPSEAACTSYAGIPAATAAACQPVCTADPDNSESQQVAEGLFETDTDPWTTMHFHQRGSTDKRPNPFSAASVARIDWFYGQRWVQGTKWEER